jgi:hypothetical protein
MEYSSAKSTFDAMKRSPCNRVLLHLRTVPPCLATTLVTLCVIVFVLIHV